MQRTKGLGIGPVEFLAAVATHVNQADGQSMETLAVHGGERWPGPEGSVVFPIYQSTVFAIDAGTDYHDIPYLRPSSTPSRGASCGRADRPRVLALRRDAACAGSGLPTK